MRSFKLWCAILAIVIFLLASGCSVLSKSQVEEIKKFANASRNYNALPGCLAESYGVLIRNSKLLSVTRERFGKKDEQGRVNPAAANRAWEKIQSAYGDETEFVSAGKQMDAALAVLVTYTNMLTILVSDDFNDKLSKKAVNLGKSLDEATRSYNDKYKKDDPIDKVGGIIGIAVRAAGGIYIRAKQAAMLKEAIVAADPLVDDLMDEVQEIAVEKIRPALSNYEKNFIGRDFKSVANNNKKVNISVVAFTYGNLYKARKLILLSDKVAKAAIAYKTAHRDLVEHTRVKKTLKEAIQQIETLSNQISAANKVKDEIDK